MKVLVLAGPESSGKSWLANETRNRFGGVLVGEYVRHFIDEQRRDTVYADIAPIARGQLAWEDAARAAAPDLLILDTHLLSNMLWSRTLFGDCPAWLEQQLLARHYDLHMLLSPEGVTWTQDGQRCQPELADRLAFFAASRDWLQTHQQLFQVVGGDWDERLETVMQAVAQLLAGPGGDASVI